jgi:glycosyltransferase involved in cell wall biosynthesis
MDLYRDVTLLITHFNRTTSLERLLLSFQRLDMVFAEVIVSDDASNTPHLQHLQELQMVYHFRIVTAERNGGLAANINRGQRAVTTPYILYVQEDFEVTRLFKTTMPEALALMEQDKGLDLVRFFAHYRYPYLRPYSGDFEKVAIPLLALDYTKIYSYSDTPHLKRVGFEKKFGAYREDLKADRMEYRMCVSFIVNKGRCVITKHYASLFIHNNLATEPSTATRPPRQSSKDFLIQIIRFWYRQLKYNWDLLVTRRR